MQLSRLNGNLMVWKWSAVAGVSPISDALTGKNKPWTGHIG